MKLATHCRTVHQRRLLVYLKRNLDWCDRLNKIHSRLLKLNVDFCNAYQRDLKSNISVFHRIVAIMTHLKAILTIKIVWRSGRSCCSNQTWRVFHMHLAAYLTKCCRRKILSYLCYFFSTQLFGYAIIYVCNIIALIVPCLILMRCICALWRFLTQYCTEGVERIVFLDWRTHIPSAKFLILPAWNKHWKVAYQYRLWCLSL